MRRFPWILTVLSALLFAGLVSLGAWQIQRMQWKEKLIAEAEAAAAEPPTDLAGLRANPAEFRTVRLTCVGLADAPYVELQTIQNGEAGVRLISPCLTAPYSMGGERHTFLFLIDRGFIADDISARPPQTWSTGAVEVTAQVRNPPPPGRMTPPPNGRRFYGRDVEAMARVLLADRPLPVSGPPPGGVWPQTLFALTSSNPGWLALKPSAPPAAFSNNHLGYAITWFGLALALAGFYIALLRRKLARPAGTKDIP